MDLGYLFRLLNRRKWLILASMLAAGSLVFYLIGKKPERYKASVLMATGIVNYKGFYSNGDDAFVQQFQIENAFSNLIDFAQSRSSFKILTIHLLRRDLNAASPGSTVQPFRSPNLVLYGPEIVQEATQLRDLLQKIRLDSITDPALDPHTDRLLDRVSRAYGYDHGAIGRSIAVKRKGNTDYLTVEVVTEHPALSQFMADAYVHLFIDFYQNLSVREKRKNVTFYKQLAKEKKAVVDTIKNRRYAYLFQKGLPALGKQSEELVLQISNLELQKQKAEAIRLSAAENMGQIQQYIDQRATLDAGETRTRVVDKYNVADLKERVRVLTEKSAASGKQDPAIEAELAGARHRLDLALQSNANNLGKPMHQEKTEQTKEELFKEKVKADMDRIEAEKSLGIIDRAIEERVGKLSAFVSNDAIATNLADEQERAEDEFEKVNEELIKANLALANAENPLQIIENAQLPEWPEPNRQTLLSVFAAIVVGTMSVIGIFLLAYFDRSIQTPEMFGKFVPDLPLLGFTPFVPLKKLDFQNIFTETTPSDRFAHFRESLRKIRTELLRSKARVYLFTSTQAAQGKTLTAYALANALAAHRKQVLILDTNFKTPIPPALVEKNVEHPVLSRLIRQFNLEGVFFTGSTAALGEGSVTVAGHRSAGASPAELLPDTDFRGFLEALSGHFDFVFMEAAALNPFSDAQELEPFADQVIAVFGAHCVIGPRDQSALAYLRGLNGRFAGAILTAVEEKNLA